MNQTDPKKVNPHIVKSLLKEVKKNNDEAFYDLYIMLKGPIYAYSLSILKNQDDALDNVQDVFITIYKQINNYSELNKPMNYIFTITKNLAITKLRKKKPMVDFDIKLIPTKNYEEDLLILKKLLENLSDEERNIIILHLLWGFKHRELASILNSNLSTILSKYNRSIKKLKKMEVQDE